MPRIFGGKPQQQQPPSSAPPQPQEQQQQPASAAQQPPQPAQGGPIGSGSGVNNPSVVAKERKDNGSSNNMGRPVRAARLKKRCCCGFPCGKKVRIDYPDRSASCCG